MKLSIFGDQLNDVARISLFEELQVLLEAGTSLPHALDAMAGDGQGVDVVGRAADRARRHVASGATIADALRPFLRPSEYHQLVAALKTDERKQIEALARMAKRLQADRDLAKQFASDLYFPPIAFLTAIAGIAITQDMLEKELAIIPPGFEFSPIASIYLSLADFLLNWWFLIPIGIISAIVLYRVSAPRLTGAFRDILDRAPILPYRHYRRRESIAFYRQVSDLLQAGYGANETLRICAQGAQPYSSWHINRIAGGAATSSLGLAVEQTGDPWPDAVVARKLRLFARSRSYAQEIGRLADHWHREFARARAARVEVYAAILNFGGILLLVFQMIAMQFLSTEIGDAVSAATFHRSIQK